MAAGSNAAASASQPPGKIRTRPSGRNNGTNTAVGGAGGTGYASAGFFRDQRKNISY